VGGYAGGERMMREESVSRREEKRETSKIRENIASTTCIFGPRLGGRGGKGEGLLDRIDSCREES
jgi:hypothetical protein